MNTATVATATHAGARRRAHRQGDSANIWGELRIYRGYALHARHPYSEARSKCEHPQRRLCLGAPNGLASVKLRRDCVKPQDRSLPRPVIAYTTRPIACLYCNRVSYYAMRPSAILHCGNHYERKGSARAWKVQAFGWHDALGAVTHTGATSSHVSLPGKYI